MQLELELEIEGATLKEGRLPLAVARLTRLLPAKVGPGAALAFHAAAVALHAGALPLAVLESACAVSVISAIAQAVTFITGSVGTVLPAWKLLADPSVPCCGIALGTHSVRHRSKFPHCSIAALSISTQAGSVAVRRSAEAVPCSNGLEN